MKTLAQFAFSVLVFAATLRADGLSVNLPLVGRVTGAGNTLFATSVDVSNNATSSVRVDFFFDGKDTATTESVSIVGSVSDFGLVRSGVGVMSAQSNQHFDDFIDALVRSNLLASSLRDDGIQGSVLFVFNGYTKRGQGAVAARFYNAFSGGNVGVAIKGHEIATGEPQKLVVTVRDTTATTGSGQVYPNVFINNTGLAPDGTTGHGDVTVQLSAVSAATHQAVGNPLTITIGSGQTSTVGHIFQALGITPTADVTALIVYATVTSGASAIEGLVSQVDTVTKDGSAFEMSRADF
jgi:hypothetical protein